jgi:EmrB/QacA subfamily drug resistance transporter
MLVTFKDMAHPGSEAVAEQADPHHARRWLVLGVLAVAQLMVVIDVTITNIALPSAQADLGFSSASREWVITAYSLAFGALLLLGGRLSDLWGRRRMFLVGATGFAAASVLGGAAPSLAWLITARGIQGVFAAILAPAALSLVSVTFTDADERSRAFAIFGAVTGGAGALGLLLGGVLTNYLSWRWCMYVNVVFAAAAVAGGAAFLVHAVSPAKPRLDLLGTVTGSAGLFFLVFAFDRAQVEGWGAVITIVSFAICVVALLAFVVIEQRSAFPLLPLRVVTDRNRAAAFIALTLASLCLLGLFLFVTYYLQGILRYSPIKTGVAFLPLPVGLAVAATVTQGQLMRPLRVRAIVVLGLLISAGGSVILAQIGPAPSYLTQVLPGLALSGLGLGLAFVVALGLSTSGVAASDAGAAGAVANTSQQVGGALGVALLSTIASSATAGYLKGQAATAAASLAHATTHGYDVAFWWAAGFFAVAAVLALALITKDAQADVSPAAVAA